MRFARPAVECPRFRPTEMQRIVDFFRKKTVRLLAGGKGSGLVFRKGKILRSVPEDQLIDALMDEIRAYEEGE